LLPSALPPFLGPLGPGCERVRHRHRRRIAPRAPSRQRRGHAAQPLCAGPTDGADGLRRCRRSLAQPGPAKRRNKRLHQACAGEGRAELLAAAVGICPARARPVPGLAACCRRQRTGRALSRGGCRCLLAGCSRRVIAATGFPVKGIVVLSEQAMKVPSDADARTVKQRLQTPALRDRGGLFPEHIGSGRIPPALRCEGRCGHRGVASSANERAVVGLSCL